MKKLTELNEWKALVAHQQEIAPLHMRDWFANDQTRFNRYSLNFPGILLDYSRNLITDKTLTLLFALANAMHLREKIKDFFKGAALNFTEKRAAFHMALRQQNNNQDIEDSVRAAQTKMAAFVQAIHERTWQGVTGKPIKHIVNFGIGGSYVGPMMCIEALKEFAIQDLNFHFVSTVDYAQLQTVLKKIDPETSLFIISSKSFSTLETLTNAQTAITWLKEKLPANAISQHIVAVTAHIEKAIAFGIPEKNIFPLWDWVGGRYSIWSAIGLPLALMIGNQHFADFLQGAHAIDIHFQETDFNANIPVILALLEIWYLNFFHAKAQAIAPYSYSLRHLITYLQQLSMESNGKSVTQSGLVNYTTSPIVFGEEGCNAQHTYQQLLHQGPHFIPVDFILVGQGNERVHQDIVIASALSQAEALMQGRTYAEVCEELSHKKYSQEEIQVLAKHHIIPGNKPSNILFLDTLSPYHLGALLAIYEHKIFVQGILWNINSFDQWGVELGKQLLPQILKHIEDTNLATGIIGHYQRLRK